MRGMVLFAVAIAAYGQSSVADRVIKTDTGVREIAFSSNAETLAGFCADGKVRVWDVASGKLLRTVTAGPMTRTLAFSPRGDVFIAGRPEKGPQVWSLQTGEAVRELPTLATRETKLAYSADASTIAAGGRDKTVRILDVSSGRERVKITGGLGGIEAFAFSPDGAALVAADNDTNIRVWSTRNGELLRLIEELPVTTFSLAFSPDGKYLASGGVDRILYLWDARTWKLLRKIPGQPEMIARVAFSPDSRLVVTGGFNDISSREPVTILVRDVESGKVLQSMPSSHAVSAAAFSPDGRLIVTTQRDAIDLWRVSAPGQR